MSSYQWPPNQSGGTVTSVALTMPAQFSVAGSPVTGSGTLAVTLANESANTVFAGPTSGGAVAPTFRALVAGDIPSLSSTYLPLAGGTMTGNIVLASTANIQFPATGGANGYLIDHSGQISIDVDGRSWANLVGDVVLDIANGVLLDTTAAQTVLDFGTRHLVNSSGTTVVDFSSGVKLPTLSASLPVKTDASSNLTAAAIALGGSEVSGTLPPTRGGTGVSNNAASTLAISGSFATTLTVTGITGVTLPTSGTLATTGGTETLTNKKLVDASCTFVDDGDNTKQFAVQCSGITTGTTRTWTVPNSSDTFVGLAATQTLTNKTLTGNTAVNLISGSGTLTLNTTGTITVPNATDTLVGKATTDTLTNKTLTGNTAANLISGSGTLTLNTSGTITVPNGTDTLVGKATTDTMTNKTLTTPQINGLQLAMTAVKTANYTATASDDIVLCDTNAVGAFTVTLPAANAGKKVFTIRKTTSDLNVLTISRAGSDTITDVAASLTSTTINTQGESITLQSDGTSIWYVTQRKIPSVWTTYTGTLTGSSSNPNIGSTGACTAKYKRNGDSIEVLIDVISGGTGITAGSGTYLLNIPSGLAIDTNKVITTSGATFRNVFGTGVVSQSGVMFGPITPGYHNTTTLEFTIDASTGIGTSIADNIPNANWFTTAGNGFSAHFTVPISGWNG